MDNEIHLGEKFKTYLSFGCEFDDLLFAIGVKLGHEDFGKIFTYNTFGSGNKVHTLKKVANNFVQFLENLKLNLEF